MDVLSIIAHYGFRSAATHFIEIQQLRLLYHNVAYTKQQLSSNNQVCRINSVRAAANSMQGPINSRFEQNFLKNIYNYFKYFFYTGPNGTHILPDL